MRGRLRFRRRQGVNSRVVDVCLEKQLLGLLLLLLLLRLMFLRLAVAPTGHAALLLGRHATVNKRIAARSAEVFLWWLLLILRKFVLLLHLKFLLLLLLLLRGKLVLRKGGRSLVVDWGGRRLYKPLFGLQLLLLLQKLLQFGLLLLLILFRLLLLLMQMFALFLIVTLLLLLMQLLQPDLLHLHFMLVLLGRVLTVFECAVQLLQLGEVSELFSPGSDN